MKIKIHKGFEDYQLTDSQKVLAAVLAMCWSYEKPDTEFFFHSLDIRTMLGEANCTPRTIAMMPFISQYEVGEYTGEVWSFKLKDRKRQSHSGNCYWIYSEIEDPRAINIYYYLVGRLHPWSKAHTDFKNVRDLEKQKRPFTHFMWEQLQMTTDALKV